MEKSDIKKCIVIYNPVSTGFKKDSIKEIHEELNNYDFDQIYVKSMYQGHSIELVKELDSPDTLIITLGGDGTVSEAYNAYLSNGQKGLYTHIPTGTTNDMAKNLDVNKKHVNGILKDALNGNIELLDTYTVNKYPVAYTSVFGYLAHVPYVTKANLKKYLGHAGYVLSAAKYLKEKPVRYDISYETDNMSGRDEFILGAISNSKGFAGIDLFKDAKLDDGKIEMLLIKNIDSKLIADLAINYVKNTIDLKKYSDHIIVDSSSNIKLTFNDKFPKFPVDVDGENSNILPNYVDKDLVFEVKNPIRILKNN